MELELVTGGGGRFPDILGARLGGCVGGRLGVLVLGGRVAGELGVLSEMVGEFEGEATIGGRLLFLSSFELDNTSFCRVPRV